MFENIDIDIDKAILADIDTNINKDLLESIDIDIDVNIDEDLLTKINIDKISLTIWDIKPPLSLSAGWSTRLPTTCSQPQCPMGPRAG